MKKHRVTPASAFGKAARELQVKEMRMSARPVNRLMLHYLAEAMLYAQRKNPVTDRK